MIPFSFPAYPAYSSAAAKAGLGMAMAGLLAVLAGTRPALAETYPRFSPANRGAAGLYSLRHLALGEPGFVSASLYNLYDQGGSPLGLLREDSDKLAVKTGWAGSSLATPGDSLKLGHGDLFLPQIALSQPGLFAAALYFHRESDAYASRPIPFFGSDSVEVGKNHFGLDMAAGPASGLFRIGFGAHMVLGSMDYPGEARRVILEIPDLRLDIGSQPLSGLELGIYTGFSAQFDSLEGAADLERFATLSLPRYGILADIDSLGGLPLQGNAVLEIGTERGLGEFREGNLPGMVYPTVWNGYWELQTQWLYSLAAREFVVQPALRFAYRSEDAQGYEGIRSNQNPFKKGDKIDGLAWERSILALGLGSQIDYRGQGSLLAEWEMANHGFDGDTAVDQAYHRFSLGLEGHLGKIPAFRLPPSLPLALRLGWTWRQEPEYRPGYRDYQFSSLVLGSQAPTREGGGNSFPDKAKGYSALTLGLGLGLLRERLQVNALLGFPGQKEAIILEEFRETSGVEWGVSASYAIF